MNDRKLKIAPAQPLNYASPPKRPFTSIPLTIGLAIPTALLCYLAIFVAPSVEVIMRDFRVELPGFTTWALTICRWISNDFGWLTIWTIPAVVPIIFTQIFPTRNAVRRSRWSVFILGIYIAWPLCCALATAACFVFSLPLVKLLYLISRH